MACYPVPDITMLTLKFVMPLMLDDTLRVKFAAVHVAGANVADSLSQVRVIGPSAVEGVHVFFVMPSVIRVLPMFFT